MSRKSIVQLKRSEVKRKRSRIASSTSEGRTFHRSTHASFKRQRTLTEFNIPTSSNLPVRSSSYSLSRFDLPTSNKNIEPVIIDDNDHKSVCLDNAGKVEIIIDTDEEDLVSLHDNEVKGLESRTEERIEDRIVTELKEQINVEISTEVIQCPICLENLSHLELYERETHCDTCIGSDPSNMGTPKKNVKSIISDPSPPTKAKRHPTASKKPTRVKLVLPNFKIIKFNNGHEVVVDGFNYRASETISQYFLSHFHSDHYIGLKKSWNNPDENPIKKTLYCSKITAILVNLKFKIPMDEIRILPMNKRFWITDTISVVALDANHCPGAIIMLFQEFLANSFDKPIRQILHTGDFRSNAKMIKAIQKWLAETTNDNVDQVYLDTTYLTMGYNFPSQHSVCNTVADFTLRLIKHGKNKTFGDSQRSLFHFQKKRTLATHRHRFLFLVGTYTIGKEKLAIRICELLKTKLFVMPNSVKFSMIQIVLQNNENQNETWDDSLLTSNLHESSVHLVPIRVLKSQETIETYLKSLKDLETDYLKDIEDVVGFIPTGWSHNFGLKYQKNSDDDNEMGDNMGYCLELMKNDRDDGGENEFDISSILRQYKKYSKFQVFNVPYSEHSSFDDLVKFGCKLKWSEIIPTVNLNNLWKVTYMTNWFQCWDKVREMRAAK
ncbi:DNA cross-link repair protein PSO2 [Saccharomyces paradoxus]|uniref:DNA cross-link repair protein PSO2 n=1 Tax=Saccharomyces paradoxus TaxID=27291 RepID=A0A8B8UXK6_SACPA|nr:Pso2 [Saccharomyces paradoxus]QHS75409.1 Pso2 [Saccharomyces paradoxus]